MVQPGPPRELPPGSAVGSPRRRPDAEAAEELGDDASVAAQDLDLPEEESSSAHGGAGPSGPPGQHHPRRAGPEGRQAAVSQVSQNLGKKTLKVLYSVAGTCRTVSHCVSMSVFSPNKSNISQISLSTVAICRHFC